MGTVTILPETTQKPITLIGERAGVCWGADTGSPDRNYRRGMDCIESGHGRVLEYVNIEMILDGYSARVMREWYTHIGGMPTRLQESTRYIDYSAFEYITPPSIRNDVTAWNRYDCAMKEIQQALKSLDNLDIPREDLAMLLPLGMCTRVVDKRNLRNLIDMSRQRMCNRAYWEFRELMMDICCALGHYSDEWMWIVNNCMDAKCDMLGYCPERHGCGKYPKEG